MVPVTEAVFTALLIVPIAVVALPSARSVLPSTAVSVSPSIVAPSVVVADAVVAVAACCELPTTRVAPRSVPDTFARLVAWFTTARACATLLSMASVLSTRPALVVSPKSSL